MQTLSKVEESGPHSRMRRAIEHVERAMRLLWGDEMLDSEGMSGTPDRVVRYWAEITRGLKQDPELPLKRTFECPTDEIVLLKDLEFFSVCEHHILPFFGVAHVAYIPGDRVVGISKIPRCLDVLARRPQLQERLTQQFAETLSKELQPKGLIVVISATHTCMTTRGVLKPGALTVTSSVLGLFKDDAKARAEVMGLINS